MLSAESVDYIFLYLSAHQKNKLESAEDISISAFLGMFCTLHDCCGIHMIYNQQDGHIHVFIMMCFITS